MDASTAPSVPDRVRVFPGALDGEVSVPGDKSISHRALLLGALADVPVTVRGVVDSGDVRATAEALRSMGAAVRLDVAADGSLAGSVAGPLREADGVLDCGNSGTALRLLAGVVAGIDGLTVLTGDASLRRRPVDRVAVPLRRLGAVVDARAGGLLPPLVVRGGVLRSATYESPVASAQVKSCVLLAGLRADGPVRVRSPRRSRDHTERMLRHLGVTVNADSDGGVEDVEVVPGPLRPAPLEVPGDPSSAAFWHAAAAVGGGTVTTRAVSVNPTRAGALAILGRMGAEVRRVDRPAGPEPVADVTVVGGGLTGGVRVGGMTVVDAIDELPVLALVGALSTGGIEVRDAAELRVKESDRIAVVAATLRGLGIDIEEFDDGYRVPGGQRPAGGVVDAHGDHRIAMTAAVAGTVAAAPVEITGFGCVATSYPTFLRDLARLGGHVEAASERSTSTSGSAP